ncbi:hypothetical protein GCM10018966_013640 [Streptomyces yanii]
MTDRTVTDKSAEMLDRPEPVARHPPLMRCPSHTKDRPRQDADLQRNAEGARDRGKADSCGRTSSCAVAAEPRRSARQLTLRNRRHRIAATAELRVSHPAAEIGRTSIVRSRSSRRPH